MRHYGRVLVIGMVGGFYASSLLWSATGGLLSVWVTLSLLCIITIAGAMARRPRPARVRPKVTVRELLLADYRVVMAMERDIYGKYFHQLDGTCNVDGYEPDEFDLAKVSPQTMADMSMAEFAALRRRMGVESPSRNGMFG